MSEGVVFCPRDTDLRWTLLLCSLSFSEKSVRDSLSLSLLDLRINVLRLKMSPSASFLFFDSESVSRRLSLSRLRFLLLCKERSIFLLDNLFACWTQTVFVCHEEIQLQLLLHSHLNLVKLSLPFPRKVWRQEKRTSSVICSFVCLVSSSSSSSSLYRHPKKQSIPWICFCPFSSNILCWTRHKMSSVTNKR